MTHCTVLIVDDERHIRRLLSATLVRSGYQVIEAENAREAMHLASVHTPEAALIDLGLPDRDGLELVAHLSEKGMSLLVVSARETTDDKIAALDLGADDFISKPFDTDELLARLRASLRRRMGSPHAQTTLICGAITIDVAAHSVTKNGASVHVTPKEFALLTLLARHAGRVVTHAQLLREIWGAAHESDIEYLRVAARSLRRKLEDDPARPTLLRNEPGIGYRISV